MRKSVGVIYHPKIPAAQALKDRLIPMLDAMKVDVWSCSAWDEEDMRSQAPGTTMAISIGGDGTILRVARAVTPSEVPIIGVNLGHLGFMAELSAEEVVEKLPDLLGGEGWTDQRTMLQVDLSVDGGREATGCSMRTFHGLNDAFVGRGAVPRVVYIKTRIDGGLLVTHKSDGVIVATATGSTGYFLAAGGPIVYPQADILLMKPMSPHLTLPYPLVLPPTAVIELETHTDHEAVLSIDGQVNVALGDGDKVVVRRSPMVARFWRIRPPNFFYSALVERLKVRNSKW